MSNLRATTLLGLAGVLACTTPALAQEPPSSADLLSAFAARCAEIGADPRAAVNALADRGTGAQGGMTSDGAMAQITEPLVLDQDGTQAAQFFIQTVAGDTARQGCTITVHQSGGMDTPPFPDMTDVADAQAKAILGGRAVRSGGPATGDTLTEGATITQMLVWSLAEGATGGPVMSLTQDARRMILSLGRTVPAP